MQELTFGYMFCDSAYFYYYNETVEMCTFCFCVSSCSAIQSEKRAEGKSAFSLIPLFYLIFVHLSVTAG